MSVETVNNDVYQTATGSPLLFMVESWPTISDVVGYAHCEIFGLYIILCFGENVVKFSLRGMTVNTFNVFGNR